MVETAGEAGSAPESGSAWDEQVRVAWDEQFVVEGFPTIVYIEEMDAFYRYRGRSGVFRELPNHELDQLILGVFATVMVVKVTKAGIVERPVPRKAETTNWFERMLAGWYLRHLVDFDANSDVVNYKNGLYRDSARQFAAHTEVPEYLSLAQVRANYVPLPAPGATAIPPGLLPPGDVTPRLLPHPLWDAYLETTFPEIPGDDVATARNLRAREVIRVWIKYAMQTRQDVGKTGCAKNLVLIGSGKNGKDQFEAIVRALFDPEFIAKVTIDDLQANPRFVKGFFIGKRLNVVGDMETSESFKKIGTFLDITGTEFLCTEIKGAKKQAWFRMQCKMVYAADKLMLVLHAQHGFYRRWEPLIFAERFDGHDAAHVPIPRIGDTIAAAEMDGIVQWAMQADLETFEWADPEAVRELWQNLSNAVYQFVDQRCERGATLSLCVDDFLSALQAFCDEKDMPFPSQKEVLAHLRDFWRVGEYKTREMGEPVHKLRGIALREALPPDPLVAVAHLRRCLEDMGVDMEQLPKFPEMQGAWDLVMANVEEIVGGTPRKLQRGVALPMGDDEDGG